MTNDELRAFWLRIGTEMGWQRYTKRGRELTTYSVRLLEHDLDLIHPGLLRGARGRLADAIKGKRTVPGYLDHPLRELLERAVAGRRDPPTAGALWVPPGLERTVQGRGAAARLIARNLMAWRQALGVGVNEIEGEAVRTGAGPGSQSYIAARRLLNIEAGRGRPIASCEITLVEDLLQRLRGQRVDLRIGPRPPAPAPDPPTQT